MFSERRGISDRVLEIGTARLSRAALVQTIVARADRPAASIFLRYPSAKNPRKRLAGDQNGNEAPSVAQNARAEIASWDFFSSRRRHTSCSRDWSSDVCSSD